MTKIQRVIGGILLGGWIWVALSGDVAAQDKTQGTIPGTKSSTQSEWRPRGSQGKPATRPAPIVAVDARRHDAPQTAAQPKSRVRAASAAVEMAPVDTETTAMPMPAPTAQVPTRATQTPARTAPIPTPGRPQVGDDAVIMDGSGAEVIPPGIAAGPGDGAPIDAAGPGCSDCGGAVGGCDQCGIDDCGSCGDCCEVGCGCGDCGACGGCGLGHGPIGLLLSEVFARDLSIFAGVHGFEGPPDVGRNGNFGFHEGVNFGSALGGFNQWGYQVGFQAVHSNFAGDQVFDRQHSNRNQVFFTTGIFRRALCGGMQWGVAFDLQHDSYYGNVNLKQIRTETGYVFRGGLREIGYFGAYGTGGDSYILIDRTQVGLEPTDMFAFYYRRYFREGGDGRFWAGFTGGGDGLLGADLRVPIGGSWALENKVNYLIPKQGGGAGGAESESWGVTIHLVWYPGKSAHCQDRSPFRPLFNVADNTLFMSTRSVSGTHQ